MADSPLVTLAKIAGGVVLMQGRLGHQVLGQLFVMNSNEVAMAAASVVVAATTGQRSVVGQMVLRTVAPALAVRVLLNKQEERLNKQEERLTDKENRIAFRERAMKRRRSALKVKNRRLQEELELLAAKLRSLEAATPAPGAPVAVPSAASPLAIPAALPPPPAPSSPAAAGADAAPSPPAKAWRARRPRKGSPLPTKPTATRKPPPRTRKKR